MHACLFLLRCALLSDHTIHGGFPFILILTYRKKNLPREKSLFFPLSRLLQLPSCNAQYTTHSTNFPLAPQHTPGKDTRFSHANKNRLSLKWITRGRLVSPSGFPRTRISYCIEMSEWWWPMCRRSYHRHELDPVHLSLASYLFLIMMNFPRHACSHIDIRHHLSPSLSSVPPSELSLKPFCCLDGLNIPRRKR